MHYHKSIEGKKKLTLKRILKDGTEEKKVIGENSSNSKVLSLKSVELYEPYSFEQLINMNKKKYRNLKIKALKTNLESSLYHLKNSIELYKELINRTEFWEDKSTYDFNFKDWNTLKKANGKLTRYYNDIKGIYQKIEMEEL